MKLRKLTSLALMGTLASAMVVPAFAAPPTSLTDPAQDYEGDALATEITTTVNIPTISVIVPTTGAVVLNPYKLSFTPTGGGTASTDQIIAPVQVMQNKSSAPITVTMVPTATAPEGVTLIEEAPATAKDVAKVTDEKQVWLQVVANACVDSAATTPADSLADSASPKKITMLANAADFDMESIDTIDLAAAGSNTDPTSDTTNKEFLAFQVQGEMSQIDTWTVDDVVEASIAWSFKIKPTEP